MRRISKRIKDEIEFRKLLKEMKKMEKDIMMRLLTRTRWTK